MHQTLGLLLLMLAMGGSLTACRAIVGLSNADGDGDGDTGDGDGDTGDGDGDTGDGDGDGDTGDGDGDGDGDTGDGDGDGDTVHLPARPGPGEPEPTPEPEPDPSGLWPDDATLTATGGARQVFLTWSAASSPTATYRVFLDGTAYNNVIAGDARELRVEGLEPSRVYLFTVQTNDTDGTWSTDGPTATAQTDQEYDPGFRRLTQEQYNHSVADLHASVWIPGCEATGCGSAFGSDEWYNRFSGGQNWGYWGDYSAGYPQDAHIGDTSEHRGGYRRLDQLVTDEHIAFWVGGTMEMAAGNYEDWIGSNLILNPCLTANSNGETDFDTDAEVFRNCVDGFVTAFGDRAFRRPLSSEEHATFMAMYDETGTVYAAENLNARDFAERGLRSVIAVLQSSPEFVYRVELGDENGNLTAYELASRLSYHFWNTMPDDALFAAAADGSLMTDAGYAAQVDRLFSDPRATPVIDEFYRDYFRVQDIPDIQQQDGPSRYNPNPSYQIVGGLAGGIQPAMQDELANLGVWFTQMSPGSYEDMFRSNDHFLECQYRSWIPDDCVGAGPYSEFVYGFPGDCTVDDCSNSAGWDGESTPATLPEPERAGLITRMGVLAHDTSTARPIRRGLYIREALLCDPVPPPENCEVVKPPEVDITQTVREKVESITEVEGTSCAGCHTTLINGFGHALGHFSSKGHYWETERMFTDQTNAEGEYWYFLADESEWRDVDASGSTYLDGSLVTFDGAHELSDTLVDSGRLESCWSREYFRFAMGRIEWASDEEAIESLANVLRAGTSLADAYKAMADIPQFKALGKPAPAPVEMP